MDEMITIRKGGRPRKVMHQEGVYCRCAECRRKREAVLKDSVERLKESIEAAIPGLEVEAEIKQLPRDQVAVTVFGSSDDPAVRECAENIGRDIQGMFQGAVKEAKKVKAKGNAADPEAMSPAEFRIYQRQKLGRKG